MILSITWISILGLTGNQISHLDNKKTARNYKYRALLNIQYFGLYVC